MFKKLLKLWHAPSIRGQANVREFATITISTGTIISVIIMIANWLSANPSAFGTTYGPVVAGIASAIVAILTALNSGTPVTPTPTPSPTPTPTPNNFDTVGNK